MDKNLTDSRLAARGRGQITLFLSLSLASGAAMLNPIDAITLDEALTRAESASPQAVEIVREVERAAAEVRASGLWPNPEFSYSEEDSGGETEKITDLSMAIPLGGRPALERAAARSGLRGAEARARQARVELRAGVRETFFELCRSQEKVKVLESGVASFDRLVEALQAREREGESSGFDRMRAERERAEVEVDRLDALQGHSRARSVLAAMVGMPAVEVVAEGTLLPAAPLPPKEELREAARSRGDLVSIDAEAERVDQLARAARRRLIPEPVVIAGTKSKEEAGAKDSGAVFGISFALPIFDRGQGDHAVAHADGLLLRARLNALEKSVEAELEAAYAQAASRRQAEEAYTRAPDPSDLARIAWAAYEGGEMGILEVLDAHRLALEVHLRSIDLRADTRRAEAALGRVAGVEVQR
jgi:cobalt-zinc-cadmium efflux system outer membrane protein